MPTPDQQPQPADPDDTGPEGDTEFGRALNRLERGSLAYAALAIGALAVFAELQGVPVLETIGRVFEGADAVHG